MQLSRWLVTIALLATAAALSGCLPRAIYQSPKVLSKGEYNVGAGLAGHTFVPGGGDLMYTGSAFFRTGTGEFSDYGVALHFTPGRCATVAGDYRRPLVTGPFLVTGRVGTSLACWWDEAGAPWVQVALEPGVLLGSDRVWGILSCPLNWRPSTAYVPAPSPFVGLGARIGNRLQLLPELGCNLALYHSEGSLIGCILGLGIQYGSGVAQHSHD
jgi:hypothetical protein